MGAELWGLILAGVAVVIGLVFRAGTTGGSSRVRADAAEAEQRASAAGRTAASEAERDGATKRLDEGRF